MISEKTPFHLSSQSAASCFASLLCSWICDRFLAVTLLCLSFLFSHHSYMTFWNHSIGPLALQHPNLIWVEPPSSLSTPWSFSCISLPPLLPAIAFMYALGLLTVRRTNRREMTRVSSQRLSRSSPCIAATQDRDESFLPRQASGFK